MIDTVVAGLVIAAISALTWVAYNHPADFKRASPRVWLVSLWGQTLIMAWFFSQLYARETVVTGLFQAELPDAAEVANELMYTEGKTLAIASMTLLAWLVFLVILEYWVARLKKTPADESAD